MKRAISCYCNWSCDQLYWHTTEMYALVIFALLLKGQKMCYCFLLMSIVVHLYIFLSGVVLRLGGVLYKKTIGSYWIRFFTGYIPFLSLSQHWYCIEWNWCNICVVTFRCIFVYYHFFHFTDYCCAFALTETCFLVWNTESCLRQSCWCDAHWKTATWEIFPGCFLWTSILWWWGWKGIRIQRAKDNWSDRNLWTPE